MDESQFRWEPESEGSPTLESGQSSKMCRGETYLVNQRFGELFEKEDAFFADMLIKERSEHQLWFKRQTTMLDETLAHQKQVSKQVVAMRKEATRQQDKLDQVLKEVRAMVAEYGPESNPVPSQKPRPPPPKQIATELAGQEVGIPTDENDSPRRDKSRETRDTSSRISVMTIDLINRSWGKIKPAKEEGLRGFVVSPLFNTLSTLVILLNAAFIGITAEYQITHLGEPIPVAFRWAEWSFYGFYLVELILKLFVLRQLFFCGEDWIWNIFDAFLVLLAIYDVVMYFIEDLTGSSGMNVTFMRLLRLLKMLKMLRVVRVMRFFRELRLMVYSISRSVRSLLWAVAMLILIMYIFALCFMQAATNYISTEPYGIIPQELEVAIFAQWLTVPESLLSLFMAITGGDDWGNFLTTCTAFGYFYHYLFIFYIMFQTIAVLNVLTGIFVDASMDAAQDDEDNVIHEATQQNAWTQDTLQQLFFGRDSHQELSSEEFLELLSHEELQAYLKSLDIDVAEVGEMFKELDMDNDGYVDSQELREGLMKMKGSARSIDMVALYHDCKKYSCQLDVFMGFVQDYLGVIQSELKKRLSRDPADTKLPVGNSPKEETNGRVQQMTPVHQPEQQPERESASNGRPF